MATLLKTLLLIFSATLSLAADDVRKQIENCNPDNVVLSEQELSFDPEELLNRDGGYFFTLHAQSEGKEVFSLKYKNRLGKVTRNYFILNSQKTPHELTACTHGACNVTQVRDAEDFCGKIMRIKLGLGNDKAPPNRIINDALLAELNTAAGALGARHCQETHFDQAARENSLIRELKRLVPDSHLFEYIAERYIGDDNYPSVPLERLVEHFRRKPEGIDDYSWLLASDHSLDLNDYVYRVASMSDLKKNRAYEILDRSKRLVRIKANPASLARVSNLAEMRVAPVYQGFESAGLNSRNLKYFPKWEPTQERGTQLPNPSYNVTIGSAATHYADDGDRVIIKSKLKDFLQGGGRLYKDVSAWIEGAYLISVPWDRNESRSNHTAVPSRIFIQE